MLDLKNYRKLLAAYEKDEEATAFLLSCAWAFMDYAHAIYDKELAQYAYSKENTQQSTLRATMRELDNAISAAHELVLANGSGLNRMAAKVGMPAIYREAGAQREPILSFVAEVLEAYHSAR